VLCYVRERLWRSRCEARSKVQLRRVAQAGGWVLEGGVRAKERAEGRVWEKTGAAPKKKGCAGCLSDASTNT
jgi:hypothetical protein